MGNLCMYLFRGIFLSQMRDFFPPLGWFFPSNNAGGGFPPPGWIFSGEIFFLGDYYRGPSYHTYRTIVIKGKRIPEPVPGRYPPGTTSLQKLPQKPVCLKTADHCRPQQIPVYHTAGQCNKCVTRIFHATIHNKFPHKLSLSTVLFMAVSMLWNSKNDMHSVAFVS